MLEEEIIREGEQGTIVLKTISTQFQCSAADAGRSGYFCCILFVCQLINVRGSSNHAVANYTKKKMSIFHSKRLLQLHVVNVIKRNTLKLKNSNDLHISFIRFFS